MKKIGLKVFSVNKSYIAPARKLFEQGLYDFIEIYAIPGSAASTAPLWKELGIPCVIHAPHYKHGVNLARSEKRAVNRSLYEEAARFADELAARYIIFHPGIAGVIEETAFQVKSFRDERILIENKPYHTVSDPNVLCNGYAPEDIALVMRESGCGFCFDVGHCFCAANGVGADRDAYLQAFLSLSPVMVHVSDNDADSTIDKHYHLGAGAFDLKRVWAQLPDGVWVTIETDRDSDADLDDFMQDVAYVRGL